MKPRKLKIFGVVAVVAMAATVAFASGVQGGPNGPTKADKERQDQLANAPRQNLGPSDPMVMGIFRNGKFHIVKIKTETKLAKLPDGSVAEEVHTTSSNADIDAQLPPVDSRLNRVVPTAAQIAAMERDVDTEQRRLSTARPTPVPAAAANGGPTPFAPGTPVGPEGPSAKP